MMKKEKITTQKKEEKSPAREKLMSKGGKIGESLMEERQSFFHTINCDEKDIKTEFNCKKMERKEKSFRSKIKLEKPKIRPQLC